MTHAPTCEDNGAYPGSCTCVRTSAVTDADREAAAKCAVLAEFRDLIRSGRADHHAEPWSVHRLTERAAIVAWLRQPRNGMGYIGRVMADKIEAGEHLK